MVAYPKDRPTYISQHKVLCKRVQIKPFYLHLSIETEILQSVCLMLLNHWSLGLAHFIHKRLLCKCHAAGMI